LYGALGGDRGDNVQDDGAPTAEAGRDDRRSLLKKAAVVAGAAWVAPVVLSRSVAAAGSAPPCAGLTLNEGRTLVSPCGAIDVVHSNPAFGLWNISGSPTFSPGFEPAPRITSVTASVPVLSKNGEGTFSVAVRLVNPNDVPTFCVTYACSN
jgi:hypothetical protein